MSLIKGINSIAITASQEPQTEVTSPSQSQPPTSSGIAGSPDLFEMATPNNFDFLEQQSQSIPITQLSTTPDMVVDASSLFSNFEVSASQSENLLQQLQNRLNPAKDKRRELQTQIQDVQAEILETQKALSSMMEALNSDKPIPDEILQVLGPLGILAIVGGLPAIPIIGGLAGLFGGLSADYKDKMKNIIAELTRKMGELELNKEQLMSELEEVDSEIESVMKQMEKEKSRLEEEARQFKTRDQFNSSDAIMAEQAYQEFKKVE